MAEVNVLFDLDGTLTDPFEGITHCISYALSSLGCKAPPREDLQWCIGPPLKNSFATLLNVANEKSGLVEEALRLYRKRFASVGLYQNKVYAEIPLVLREMQKAGYTLYVATAKPAFFAKQILKHFQLHNFFKATYGSEFDGTRCEKTDLIHYLLEQESLRATDTWMVGDRKHDMIGAKNNNVAALGVSWGYGSRQELSMSGADVLVDMPHELLAYFSGTVEKQAR